MGARLPPVSAPAGPPLSCCYRRLRSCRGARRSERRRAHRRWTQSRRSPLSAAPRPLDLGDAAAATPLQYYRGGRHKRARMPDPVARTRTIRVSVHGICETLCAPMHTGVGDACTRVMCVCGCFGCCLRSTGRPGRHAHSRPGRAGHICGACTSGSPQARKPPGHIRTSMTPPDAGGRAAPAHLYDEHAGNALAVSRGRRWHDSGPAWR